MTKKFTGYALWARVLMRDARREPCGYTWVPRTTRDPITALAMCQALARDLDRCGVAWLIKDAAGVVVERSAER